MGVRIQLSQLIYDKNLVQQIMNTCILHVVLVCVSPENGWLPCAGSGSHELRPTPSAW
ncbi:hypothetical protein NC652_034877 [Populus alba x Populus x berolinensis]|nr:hypothetical protein NC652_034877 [Populus alba x Populus x berolinensis]